MDFSHVSFSKSAPSLNQCPQDSLSEVAFAGRSNAGKSSAINAITGQTGLARTSKTPGRTQLINYFTVTPGRYLVDLPGYGYAKVPLRVKQQWQRELEDYLRQRQPLSGLILLSDIRHPLKEFDRMMIDWAHESRLPLHLLLTKADKLKRGAAQNTLLAANRQLVDYPGVSTQLFSALKQQGIDQARKQVSAWLEVSRATGSIDSV